MRVSSKFGALQERFYKKRIYLQVLKTPKQQRWKSGSFSVRRSDTPHVVVAGFSAY
jgi:hypothetical protein